MSKVQKTISKKQKAIISPVPVPVTTKADNKEIAKKAENKKKVRVQKPKNKMTEDEKLDLVKQQAEEARLGSVELFDKLSKDKAQLPETLSEKTLAFLTANIDEVRWHSLTMEDQQKEFQVERQKEVEEMKNELKELQEELSLFKSDRLILLRTDNFESFVEILGQHIKECGDEVENLQEEITENSN